MSKKNKNKNVVIGIFDNDDWVRLATNRLKEWDRAESDIKLGTFGTIKNVDGQVKTKVEHKTGKGAKAGATLMVVAALLTGGVGLVVTAGIGGAAGAVVGRLFKKNLQMSKDEIEKMGQAIEAGKVALAVTCDEHEIEGVRRVMANAGGEVINFALPEDELEEAVEAVEEEAEGLDE